MTLAETGGILPPESLARVLVANLDLRAEPGLAGALTGRLTQGSVARILGNASLLGPVSRDGFDWYLVQVPDGDSGWVAQPTAGPLLLATVRRACDASVRIDLLAFETLVCFGGRQLTLEGTYGCGECGGYSPGSWDPDWLANPILSGLAVLEAKPGFGVGRIGLHLPPALDIALPPVGSIVSVIGHFDDAAARTCQIAAGEPDSLQSADPRSAVLYCRERFVVESFENVGTDPSFPR